MKFIILTLFGISIVASHPHLYSPHYNLFRYNDPLYYNTLANYANSILNYSPVPTYSDDLFHDRVAASYLSTPDVLPTLNILAEVPYTIANKFTVVPMLVVSKDNMNMISNAHIMSVSKKKPVVTIKTRKNNLLQCTPAVKILLEQPIVVYSLKSSILFPTQVQILHEGYRIPIRVGAVIAPVPRDTYVSVDTPVFVDIVYAVPTKPVSLDYVNNEDAIFLPDTEAVVVESDPELPPKNVTVIDFPENEASPSITVDEEDEELVDRNPPIVLAPAGIVQSTQPQTIVEPFHNSKESPFLTTMREEAKKRI